MKPLLYDRQGSTKLGILSDAIACKVTEERNGEFELELEYPSASDLLIHLSEENIIIADANDTLKNQKFRIYMSKKLMSNRIVVYARHISFDLAYDWVDSINIENQPCEYTLNTIFRNSQFSSNYRGYSDIVEAKDYSINATSCLKAIAGQEGSIVDTYGNGAEILRDNTDIYIYNSRGHDNDVTIEYRKNLTGLTVEEDTTDLVTRIKPYAVYTDSSNNEIRVEGDFFDSPLINNYVHPYISYIDYSSEFNPGETPTPERLQSLATQEYKLKCDIPNINYKIEFIPLSKCVGYEGLEDRISLCDTVTIIDTRYNINTQAKVIKAVYNVIKDRYEKMELGSPRTTLGDVIGGADKGNKGDKGDKGDKGEVGADGSIGDFPDTLPPNPIITHKLFGFASIELSWSFENKTYYSYELYASKIKGFVPNTFNLLFAGQASTFLHQVNTQETWYYRVCAINSHGNRTEFSDECEVTTIKVDDLSDYVASASISEALIGTLSLDRGWVGQLQGNWIDARQLSVTDGNGKRTLDIDSFGNVNLDVNDLKIQSKGINDIAREISLEVANQEVDSAKSEINKTLKNYPTTTDMNSAILLKANEITSTVEVTKTSGVEVIPQTYTINSTSGFYATTGTIQVNQYGLYSKEKTFIKSQLIAIDRTKPIYCKYDFTTVGTGTTHIGFEQYDCDGVSIGENDSTLYWVSKTNHTGWATGDYTLQANTLKTDTRYVKLRILINWNASADFQYTQFKVLSALQLQARSASTQIAQMEDRVTSTVNSINTVDGKINSAQSQIDQQATQISTKVNVDGVKTVIQQNPDSVKIGFNGISDYVEINSTRFKVGHSDASYTEIGQNGFKYYDSYANWNYHALMKQGWLGDISGTSWSRTVTLPNSFKGKVFSVIVSVEQVNAVNTHDVIKHYKVTVPQSTVDYANGKFVINMSALAYYVPGQASATSITTNVSWIAIC